MTGPTVSHSSASRALVERGDVARGAIGRSGAEPADHRHRRLLRARRERPREYRSAEKRDEFAPSQDWPPVPPLRIH
jgi:hypothetical protein